MSDFWQDAEKGDDKVHELLFSTMDAIVVEQSRIYDGYRDLYNAYSDRSMDGFEPGDNHGWPTLVDSEDSLLPGGIPITVNASRSCVDTVCAKLTMHDPMPRILPLDAPESTHEKAELLQKFLIGAMAATDLEGETRKALRDSCIYGTGVLRVDEGDGTVRVKRVHPYKVVVDDNAALDGPPTTIMLRDHWSKGRILRTFGTGKDASLKTALAAARSKEHKSATVRRDLVQIVEAHYKPESGPGRRVVALNNFTLVDEEWTDDLPYEVHRWQDPDQGWHGIGLVEEILPIQSELNELSQKIQLNMALLATPYVLVPLGSKIDDGSLEEVKDARIIEYSGAVPPRVETPPAMHPQVFQERNTLYDRAYELSGVSKMSAQSERPGAIRAALAMMTLQDVESQRFSQQSKKLERMRCGIGRLMIQAGRRLANTGDKGKSWSVKGAAKGFVQKITWSEVSMKDDRFDLQIQPQSSLPYQAAGRIEQVIRLSERGIINPAEARDLLKMPDLAKWEKLANAPMDDLQRLFEHMSSTGELIEPHDFQDLQLGKRLCVGYWSRARIEGNEEGANALEGWLNLAEPSISAEQAMAQGLPAAGAPPQGIGGQMAPGMPPGPAGMPPGMPPAPGAMPPGMEGP